MTRDALHLRARGQTEGGEPGLVDAGVFTPHPKASLAGAEGVVDISGLPIDLAREEYSRVAGDLMVAGSAAGKGRHSYLIALPEELYLETKRYQQSRRSGPSTAKRRELRKRRK